MKNKKEKNQIKTMVSIPMLVIMIMVVLISSIGTSYAATYIFNSKDVGYDNQKSGIQSDNVQGAIDELYDCASDYSGIAQRLSTVEGSQLTMNSIYPVGSIYISVSNTNPSTLFGGTWVAFGEGRTIIGMGSNGIDNYTTVEDTSGSSSKTLTTSNLPSHSHYYTPSGTNSGGSVNAHTYTPQGSINVAISDHTYTPAGTVSKPTFSGTRAQTEESGAHAHYGYSGYYGVNSGASVWVTVDNGNDGRSLTTASPTQSGGVHKHYYTPSGTVSQPTFTGTKATLSHTVSTKTFTGTKATLSPTVTQPTFTGTRSQTESTGSGTAFSTMNPYITVYMWKRTA